MQMNISTETFETLRTVLVAAIEAEQKRNQRTTNRAIRTSTNKLIEKYRDALHVLLQFEENN